MVNAKVQFRSGFVAHLFQKAKKFRCLGPQKNKMTRDIKLTIGLLAMFQVKDRGGRINRNKFPAFRNTWRLEKNLIWSLRTITKIINLLLKVKMESR